MNPLLFDTPDALAEQVAADFAMVVQTAVTQRGRCTVAFPGGSSPKLFFRRLTQEPYRTTLPWGKLWIFWGDERCVPKEHPDSNFRVTQEMLLQYVPVRSDHVFRMRGEDPPPQAGRDYENKLREIFPGESWPVFDLILLGLGPDGHTASLMAGTPALIEQGERWVVGNVIRALQTVRITLTLPAINHARQVWFLVTGAKKREAFARAQQGPHFDCPASLVHPENGELRWYVDAAVASGQSSEVSK